jgi:hypothetical protein
MEAKDLFTLEELKREIDRLFELQRRALDRATYLGMTPEQAREIEERRRVITKLFDQFAALRLQE